MCLADPPRLWFGKGQLPSSALRKDPVALPSRVRFPTPRLLIERPHVVPQGLVGAHSLDPGCAHFVGFTAVRSEFLVLILEMLTGMLMKSKAGHPPSENHMVLKFPGTRPAPARTRALSLYTRDDSRDVVLSCFPIRLSRLSGFVNS